jgi:hypothetical protein
VLTTHPHFVFCLFRMACIAFGCPASTPQAPFPAKRCSARTLRAVSHARMVSNAWGSCFLIDSVRLVKVTWTSHDISGTQAQVFCRTFQPDIISSCILSLIGQL